MTSINKINNTIKSNTWILYKYPNINKKDPYYELSQNLNKHEHLKNL